MPIIDIHAHYGEWFFPIYRSKPEDIEDLMKKYNIEAVILSSAKAVVYDMVEGNRELSSLIKSRRGFYGYVYVNPNYPELSKTEVDRYLSEPLFKGVGEVHPAYAGVPVNSENFISIVKDAANYRKPFLIHTYREQEVRAVAELAEKFPELTFIMAHMGGTDNSGTGLNWKAAISAGKELSNVFLEICMTKLEKPKVEEAVERAGAEKIMFGSDLTLLNPSHVIGMILDANISKSDREKIFYLNAKRVFRI